MSVTRSAVPAATRRPARSSAPSSCAAAWLHASGFHATDLSPRALSNTYARRSVLDGHPHADVSAMLGLASL
ncbi:hypothetical protein WS46_16835 [Burkholderia sp. RF4-BP95]|nr:hypothetical protein WS46_16835 [Burkholderia sp. RF4-BP95]